MKLYDYCIIGGGPAGIGVLDRLLQEGQKNCMLFEGRDELLYTLTFMPFIKQTSPMFQSAVSGTGFKTHLLETNRPEPVLSLGSRLIGLISRTTVLLSMITAEKILPSHTGNSL